MADEQHTSATAADVALYRRRARLNLYEAACLAHGQDPERLFSAAYDDLNPDIRRTALPSEVAGIIEAMASMMLGDVGETIGRLKKMTGATVMQLSLPVDQMADLLADLGLSLPWTVEEKKPVPDESTSAHDTRLLRAVRWVIETYSVNPFWPTRELVIEKLRTLHDLGANEAKAVDTVTRPDERRGRR